MGTLINLGDVAEFINGGAWNQSAYSKAGIPVVRVSDIHNFTVNLSSCKYLPESALEKYSKNLLIEGDLVICTVGSHPTQPNSVVGRPGIMPRQCSGALLNQNAVCIRPSTEKLDRTWLGYLARSQVMKDHIIAHARGSASQVRVAIGALKDFTFEMPDIEVQVKIANALQNYDALIENNNRRIAILEDMAQSLYHEWFVSFRFPGYKKCQFKDSLLGQIPEGWKVKALGEFAQLTMGLSPKGSTYTKDGTGMPLINGPVEFGEKFTRKTKWTTAPTKLCRKGDLIVCVRGSTTGKFVKSDGEYCLGRGVCSINSNNPGFVHQLFKVELPKLLAQTNGSTFPSWTGPQLKGYQVLIPPNSLLQKFEDLVLPMNSLIFTLSEKIDIAKGARDMLLPKLISGKIKV